MNIALIVIGIVVFIIIINSANITLKSGVESTKDRVITFLRALSVYIVVPAVLYSGVSIIAGEINAVSIVCIIFIIIYVIDIAIIK